MARRKRVWVRVANSSREDAGARPVRDWGNLADSRQINRYRTEDAGVTYKGRTPEAEETGYKR